MHQVVAPQQLRCISVRQPGRGEAERCGGRSAAFNVAVAAMLATTQDGLLSVLLYYGVPAAFVCWLLLIRWV
jgi:hypothetical protein